MAIRTIVSGIDSRLRARRLRRTGPRRAVLLLLEKERLPLSAREIWDKLSPARSDRVSIYRILDRFEKEGLVERAQLGDATVRYELKREHHHHVRCVACGRIEDVSLCVKDLEKKVLRQNGFYVLFHDLQLSGRCARCALRSRGEAVRA